MNRRQPPQSGGSASQKNALKSFLKSRAGKFLKMKRAFFCSAAGQSPEAAGFHFQFGRGGILPVLSFSLSLFAW